MGNSTLFAASYANLSSVLASSMSGTLDVTICSGTTVDSIPALFPLTINTTGSVALQCQVITVPNSCVLDGGGTSQILRVKEGEVNISGIRFQNGHSPIGQGGALFVGNSTNPPQSFANVTVNTCEFYDNFAVVVCARNAAAVPNPV